WIGNDEKMPSIERLTRPKRSGGGGLNALGPAPPYDPEARRSRHERFIHSLRQPGLAHRLYPSGQIVRPPDRKLVLETGNAQRGSELTQPRHGLLRLHEPPGERSACSGCAYGGEIIWLLAYRHFRPGRCFGIAAGEEMSQSGGGLHIENMRIVRAQAHGSSFV